MNNGAVAYSDFLRGLWSNPRGVSAPTPSGPVLARAIAAQVDVQRDGLIIELGPGTGVVTGALLDRGVSPDRIVAIEQTACFAELVARRFPAVRVHEGDALNFERYLDQGANVAAIVSGLPLLQMPRTTGRSLIRRGLACQGQGGRFIQLSYSWRPPVEPDPCVKLRKIAIWRNLPPAHIWIYSRP
jgi:phosphatidylethanolamine/phosphatidyl-N-methylethanolamine N-methyltransferase